MKKWTALLVLVTALVTSGCALKPEHVRPAAPVPATWKSTEAPMVDGNETLDQLAWDGFILDPVLKQMIQVALEENRDLRLSLLNVEAVRAQYRITDADRLPTISVGTAAGRRRSEGDTNADYSVNAGFSDFELDFWGRVKNLSESALQEYLASKAAGDMARLTLISEVSQAYLRRLGAQEQYNLIAATLASRETGLELMTQRRKFGDASDLDYQEAFSLAEQARADLESMARQLAQADNALDLLVGRKLDLSAASAPHGELLRDVPPGLSSELLLRRSDIQAAEHRLMAQSAEIGAARAAFFPRIVLTTQAGASSADLSDLFKSGSLTWQFMPRLDVPIFTHGRLKAALELVKVRKERAVVEYEKSIQTAFREVADALVSRETLKREEASLKALADSSARSLYLAKLRYDQGVDNHLRYLDAQRADLANQIRLIQTRTQKQIALVQLFASLGGGWEKS